MIKFPHKNIGKYLAVVGLLIFLYFFGLLFSLEGAALTVLNPVMGKLQALGTGLKSEYNNQTSKQDLNQELETLRKKLSELSELNASCELAEEENILLRESLGFFTKEGYEYIMANIISRGDDYKLSDITETIIIDKGSNDGLEKGQAIVSSKGIIIGKIYEVKSRSAMAYLTNSPDCKLAATILNEERTSGVTEGDLGLTIKMNFIPQSADLNPGDMIVTSGLEAHIPRGLIIGKVAEVTKDSNDLWQSAVIEPLIDNEKLIFVSVIKQ